MNKCHNNNQSNRKLSDEPLRIALVGSPNVGKSTIFNSLCGLSQHVGNWPGKTVEKKEGTTRCGNRVIKLMDLPGIYSLSANSVEEQITRNYIVDEKPDLVINIVDASNLERNLLLTTELLELTPKVIVVLNMIDIANTEGYEIDVEKLEQHLGVKVVPLVATRKGVMDTLSCHITSAATDVNKNPALVDYQDLESKISLIIKEMGNHPPYPPRFAAVKALEEDEFVVNHLKAENTELPEGYSEKIKQLRHSFIHNLISEVTIKRRESQGITDKIDRIVLSPIWGVPILLTTLFSIFYLTFTISSIFQKPIELLFSVSGSFLENILLPLPSWVPSLIVDGILAGVGGVMTFLPLMTIFFILFSLLEDSGYFPRIAFILDRFMSLIGLQGKAFFSVLMGYGCNIAGIMATRILEREEDRVLSILLNPIIPCSARLGVITLISSAFFGHRAAFVVTLLIVFDLLLIGIIGFIFKNIFFKKRSSYFLMELPLYHVPHLKTIFLFSFDRIKTFIYRAGTIIVFLSVIVWILSSFPTNTPLAETYLGRLGRILMPVTRLMGFNQELTTSLLTGFVAKESVISTLAILYSTGEETLMNILLSKISPLTAFVYLIVTMLYVPCVATIATIFRETGSYRWTVLAIMYNLVLATLSGIVIYQAGKLLGFG
ncbi:MAG: Fe(2+) transporter FeoB [candidate division WS2 bacterium]|nr:Fe(2+) transporter FeoB [Candidatus Lithacetigena glycinireducens]